MHTNGASSAAADEHVAVTHASIGKTGVHTIDADTARLERAAVRRLRATNAVIERSNIAYARVDHATLRQANVGIVAGKSVACDQVRTVVLASPVVRGEVHTLIDLRTAFAVGVGMAVGRLLLGAFRGGRAAD